ATVLVPLFLLANPSATAAPPAALGPSGDVRKAVERSIAYLEKEGMGWVKKQKCASCHHAPMMVWALNEVRSRGYRVNEPVLGEIMSWALAEKNRATVFPDLPVDHSRTEVDYLGPLVMALAVGAGQVRDE